MRTQRLLVPTRGEEGSVQQHAMDPEGAHCAIPIGGGVNPFKLFFAIVGFMALMLVAIAPLIALCMWLVARLPDNLWGGLSIVAVCIVYVAAGFALVQWVADKRDGR